MTSFKLFVVGMLLGTTVAGCSYAGVATTADNKVVVTKNNGFLFGILNAIYVCDVTPGGLANCKAGDAP